MPLEHPGSTVTSWNDSAWGDLYTGASPQQLPPPVIVQQPEIIPDYTDLIAQETANGRSPNFTDLIGYV